MYGVTYLFRAKVLAVLLSGPGSLVHFEEHKGRYCAPFHPLEFFRKWMDREICCFRLPLSWLIWNHSKTRAYTREQLMNGCPLCPYSTYGRVKVVLSEKVQVSPNIIILKSSRNMSGWSSCSRGDNASVPLRVCREHLWGENDVIFSRLSSASRQVHQKTPTSVHTRSPSWWETDNLSIRSSRLTSSHVEDWNTDPNRLLAQSKI